jgi:alkyl hydroperoxide reductase subunit AhpC
MRRTSTAGFAIATAALCLAAALPAGATLAIGSTAPEFQLTDAAGKTHKLADYRGKTVVLEWINPNCPFSRRQAAEAVMIDTAKAQPDVVWLAVNSTASGHRDYVAPADHLAWNKEHGIGYPVLYDTSGTTGKAYEAQTTPHMFVIDEQGKVVYNGAIDNDPPGRLAKAERSNYVAMALAALDRAKAADPSSTKPYGCSVKYGG